MVQDPTMLHEAVGYQVYEAAGVPVPRTSYVRLTVNGQDYGLYLNVETTDSLFLEHRFGNSKGILYEGSYGADLREGSEGRFQLHEGSDPGHAQLTALIHAVHASGDGVFYGDTAQVDTKEFLAMMAAAALLDDWDNYYAANNYRIYWNPNAQRWSFIPTGIDQTFGGYATSVYGAAGVLFMRCLGSERCRTEYAATVRDVADRFEQLGLASKMDALLSLIEEPSRSDPKRPYDDETMRRARESMRHFIANQPARVRAELPHLDGAK
jgi:spore coat protein CotH